MLDPVTILANFETSIFICLTEASSSIHRCFTVLDPYCSLFKKFHENVSLCSCQFIAIPSHLWLVSNWSAFAESNNFSIEIFPSDLNFSEYRSHRKSWAFKLSFFSLTCWNEKQSTELLRNWAFKEFDDTQMMHVHHSPTILWIHKKCRFHGFSSTCCFPCNSLGNPA